jgi:ABC-2 type transport system ATP-binding protein
MRMITGLNEPAAGRLLVNGQRYRVAAAPMAELGILLEARAAGTGRSARNHRLALAQTNHHDDPAGWGEGVPRNPAGRR